MRDYDQASEFVRATGRFRYHEMTSLTDPFTGKQVPIDDGIVDDVVALWERNIQTWVSCEGERFRYNLWVARYVGIANADQTEQALEVIGRWTDTLTWKQDEDGPGMMFFYSDIPTKVLWPDRVQHARMYGREMVIYPPDRAEDYVLA